MPPGRIGQHRQPTLLADTIPAAQACVLGASDSNRRNPSKLSTDTVLFGVAWHFLAQGWWLSQIADTLKLMWRDWP